MPNYGQHNESSYKERFDKRQKDRLSRNWERSDGYVKVGVIRNGINIGQQDIHMFNLGIEGKTITEFVAHPNQPIHRGDILIDPRDSVKYLVWRHDQHKDISDFGKLEPMFNIIKYKVSDSDVIEIPYFIETYGIGAQDPTNRIPTSSNKKMLWCQSNVGSKIVKPNDRFVLGSQLFRCTYIDDFSNPNIITFTMEATQKHPMDDIENGIAYNNDVVDEPIQEGDTLFSKSALSIRLNQSDSVTVYTYIEEVVQADTFTFRIDGIPSTSYSLTNVAGNGLTVKALVSGHSGLLVAINDLTDEETSIAIELRGLF